MSKGYEVCGDNWFWEGNAFHGVWKGFGWIPVEPRRTSDRRDVVGKRNSGGESTPTEEQFAVVDRRSFLSGISKKEARVETNYVVIVIVQ